MAKKAVKTVKADADVSRMSVDAPLAEVAVKTTRARKTTVPPKATVAADTGMSAPTPVNDQMIAERAYQLWQSGSPGGEHDHWHAAERELRGR